MLRRHAYLWGVFAGVLASGVLIAGLALGGVLDTSALYVEYGPGLRAWDKRGARESESW